MIHGVCRQEKSSLFNRARHLYAAAILAVLIGASLDAAVSLAQSRHGIAIHGEPALPEGFRQFPYVNPDAPEGGELNLCLLGRISSDVFVTPRVYEAMTSHEYATRQMISELIYDSLLVPNHNEPYTLYGLIARTAETSPARNELSFSLDAEARFSDGSPITPDDVIFSFKLFRDRGHASYKDILSKVISAEAFEQRSVRFTFPSWLFHYMLPTIGLMPIVPKHATNPRDLNKSPPTVVSGPYSIESVDEKDIALKRNSIYWARQHPTRIGFDNFDEMVFKFFLDADVRREAFMAGFCDIIFENDLKAWNTRYDTLVRRDVVEKRLVEIGYVRGMVGILLNTRQKFLAHPLVRKSITKTFNLNWVRGDPPYNPPRVRAAGYFGGSELSSIGRRADEYERKILSEFSWAVEPNVMEGKYRPAEFDHDVRREIIDELSRSGYEFQDGALIDAESGQAVSLRYVVPESTKFRKFGAIFENIGVTVRTEILSWSEYRARLEAYDFDITAIEYTDLGLSPNPAVLYDRWGKEGGSNYGGIRHPAVEMVLKSLFGINDRPTFVSAVRALDRLLISGYYVVPLYIEPDQLVAHWKRVSGPGRTSTYGVQLRTWWASGVD